MAIKLLIDERLELNVAVTIVGLLILVLGLLRNFFNTKFPASTIMVAMITGIILGPSVLDLVDPHGWGDSHALVEEVARLIISIQLMAIALGISFHYLIKAWRAQLVLITLIVGLMWITSGFIVYGFFKIDGGYDFTVWHALLIGACLGPTDPIVASAVADSALAIRLVPARIRHTITAESGINDGTGFPFVLLCLRFVMRERGDGYSAGKHIYEWIVHDILWEVALGVLLGVVCGYLIGRLLVWAEPSKLHDQQLLVALTVALAFLFMGGSTLLGVDGFLVVIVGGVVYARVVEGKKRGAESQLQETVDLIFATLAFLLFGLVIPFEHWHMIGWWRGILLVICITLFRRIPWVLLCQPLLKQQIETVADSLFLGYFGPIGLGAIFYALHAVSHLHEDSTWVVVSFLVFTQVIVFGVTDTILILWYGSSNPTYYLRRRRKHRVMRQAAEEIHNIQEALADQLENLPTSPTKTVPGLESEEPPREPLSHFPSIFNLDADDSPDPVVSPAASRPTSRRPSISLLSSPPSPEQTPREFPTVREMVDLRRSSVDMRTSSSRDHIRQSSSRHNIRRSSRDTSMPHVPQQSGLRKSVSRDDLNTSSSQTSFHKSASHNNLINLNSSSIRQSASREDLATMSPIRESPSQASLKESGTPMSSIREDASQESLQESTSSLQENTPLRQSSSQASTPTSSLRDSTPLRESNVSQLSLREETQDTDSTTSDADE